MLTSTRSAGEIKWTGRDIQRCTEVIVIYSYASWSPDMIVEALLQNVSNVFEFRPQRG